MVSALTKVVTPSSPRRMESACVDLPAPLGPARTMTWGKADALRVVRQHWRNRRGAADPAAAKIAGGCGRCKKQDGRGKAIYSPSPARGCFDRPPSLGG